MQPVYDEGLSELMIKANVFNELLEAREPVLFKHLVNFSFAFFSLLSPPQLLQSFVVAFAIRLTLE